MKRMMGISLAALALSAVAAEAQMLPPMRGETVVRITDVGGPYAAMPREAVPYGAAPAVLPAREVYAILREAGFSPLGAPQQRGLVYTVSAIDRDGEDGRMVIDARSGRILRFMPAYRMGARMEEEVVARYGPEASLPAPPEARRPPAAVAPHAPVGKLASRTPAVPLPKRAPVRPVAAPDKPVAATTTQPVAVPPVAPPAEAPVQQSAVAEPKPAETSAPAAQAPVAAPTVPPAAPEPAVDAKPTADKPADTPPAVQGLE